jgi:hypothetical protein
MPEGSHPMPALGWRSLPFVTLDGQDWPLEFAARMLDIPLTDLRKRVKDSDLQPSGVIRMRGYSSQGRQPRAYPAVKLIELCEGREFPEVADSV